MHQCREGWHRTDEPERLTDGSSDTGGITPEEEGVDTGGITSGGRRVRSTKRRQQDPPLPKVPMEDRTVGAVFTAPDGTEHRPSMSLTLTLPSYGPVEGGAPRHPESYNYRRAALDALLFSRLIDLFWKTLRRCAGFDVQYFSTVEEQRRLAPHLHAAIRGAIPRKVLREVVAATCLRVWWPAFDVPVFTDRAPVWVGTGYADPETGAMLPTWGEALDALDDDPDARPAHVMRFGRQIDVQGIVRGQPEADRAIRYLVKYLTKDLASTYCPEGVDAAYEAHIDRLHAELRFLPCSEACANWLRYGVQPKDAGPGLAPGRCSKRAHERENLGIGG